MPNVIRYIFLAFLIFLVVTPCYPEQLFIEEIIEKEFSRGVTLYKEKEFRESLAIFEEIKKYSPGWDADTVAKYIKFCRHKNQ